MSQHRAADVTLPLRAELAAASWCYAAM